MVGATVKTEDKTKRVREAAARATFRNLKHGVATIRIYAVRSLKKRSGESAPGTPPHTRGALKRAVRFFAANGEEEAIAGPEASQVGESGAAHEHGEEYRGDDFPQRSFMGPALEANEDRFASSWAGSIGD